MSLNTSSMSAGNNNNNNHHNHNNANNNGGDVVGTEFRDPRATLGIEEMVSEEEARRRREQLNRRPSYRMILKDLETVGDKPMKRELDEDDPQGGCDNGSGLEQQQSSSMQQQLDSSTADSGVGQQQQQFQSNGVSQLIGQLKPPPIGRPPGLPPLPPGLRIVGGGGGGPSVSLAASQLVHLQSTGGQPHHLSIGQLNLIPPGGGVPPLVGDIPSQPQPQQIPAQQLNSVNNLEMLGLKAPDSLTSASFVPNDWQNSLLGTYNRHQQQQASNQHLMHQNAALSLQQQQSQQQQQSINLNSMQPVSPAGTDGMSPQQQQQQMSGGGPPHGMGSRQGSASLTSLSDHDETNRKRQVRLLKNREAAKECRRKKKEYVKCLENRVAVLENQNKALIEELKTLKELYCRKEKGDLQ